MNLIIDPQRLTRLLLTVAGGLCCASIAAQAIRSTTSSPRIRAAAGIFKLDGEGTLPSYFSALLLLTAACVVAVVATSVRQNGGRFVRHWIGLAIIFALMSIDESVGAHEVMQDVIRDLIRPRGIWYFAWVIVGIPFVLATGLIYLKFIVNLPPATRRSVILAGAIYVGGALGVEMVGSMIADSRGMNSVAYVLSTLVEESMEMVGVILFIGALLLHLRTPATNIRVRVASLAANDPRRPNPARPGSIVGHP